MTGAVPMRGRLRSLSGRFAAPAGLALLLAGWQIGHARYGPIVLPAPYDSAVALVELLRDGRMVPAIVETTRHALIGFAAAALVGGVVGACAGLSDVVRRMMQPIATLMLGIPAIAWVVLALLWFGSSLAVPFTVFITAVPIVFAGAAQGAHTLDGTLRRMARAFRVPRHVLVREVYLPHMLSFLFPALATSLALSLKVAVMTELLSGTGGVGDGLATARAHVDTAEVMAWILAIVALLLSLEYLLLEPLRRHMQTWRQAAGPEPSGIATANDGRA